MKKGDKTCGIGGVLVGRQDTSVFKRSKVVRFRENAKAIRVYKRGVVVDKSRGREVKKSRSNRVGLYRKGEAGLFVGGKSDFLVPKVGPKKYRLVIDLKRLNRVLPVKVFHFEGLRGLLRTIGRNWWMIVFNLRDGYHHVLMDKWVQHFLGFRVGEKWFYYTVLPFGLSQSPWIFSKIMRALIGSWRS